MTQLARLLLIDGGAVYRYSPAWLQVPFEETVRGRPAREELATGNWRRWSERGEFGVTAWGASEKGCYSLRESSAH